MNICFITAQIIEMPKRSLNKSKYSTLFRISFPYKKEQLCYAEAIVHGKISDDAFDLYFKGDYIIIEGKLTISENINKNKNLIVYVVNIHPAHVFMQK